MDRLLDSDLDLVVKGGFLYLPLLFDPEVEREVSSACGREPPEGATAFPGETVIRVSGRHYLKTLRLTSLTELYRDLRRGFAERLRKAGLERYGVTPSLDIDGRLPVILFQVLPHFVRTRKGPSRRGATQEEVLGFLRSRLSVPGSYIEAAARFVDTEPLRVLLRDLEEGEAGKVLPENGPLPARDLRAWLFQVVEREILRDEKGRLQEGLVQRERFRETPRDDLAAILYLAEKGTLEIDGFGFFRRGEADDYVIYRRTGAYALRDYYGRLYLFPDCRVAVSTTRGRLHPLVLDRYKHPFLFSYEAGQEICLRHFTAPKEFSAANVIAALEEGLATLYYGYNPRLRNGYHSLDPAMQIRRSLDFTEYRIPSDHPDVVSGKVEVTNART
jgi:hypothetical protein